jgi:hypothetical protein
MPEWDNYIGTGYAFPQFFMQAAAMKEEDTRKMARPSCHL